MSIFEIDFYIGILNESKPLGGSKISFLIFKKAKY